MNKLGEGLARRMTSAGSVLRNPSVVESYFGFSGTDQRAIDRLLRLQDEAGFFVRYATLPSGARARMVVQGNLRRVELWAAEEDTATVTPPVLSMHFMMQHGLEAVRAADLISDPINTQSRVYPGTAIAAYYAGAGWQIPDRDPAETTHFTGLLESRADNSEPPVWLVHWPREGAETPPADPPTIADGCHAGLHGAGATALGYLVAGAGGGYQIARQPAGYTGGARAWAQDWQGAGMTDTARAARLPDGWSLAPEVLGLVVDPSGAYWSCQASAAGLVMQRMVCGPTANPVLSLLPSVPVGIARALAGAYPLADLMPDPFRPTDSVLSSSAVSAVYANSAAPLRGGWQWYWQPAGAGPAKSVQTLIWPSTTGWYARTCYITITWADGEPSATVIVGSTEAWGGGVLRLLEDEAPFSTGAAAGPATVYSWTTIDGGVSYLEKMAPVSASSVSASPYWANLGCGAGDDWSHTFVTESRSSWVGSWRIIGTHHVSPPTQSVSSRTSVHREAHRSVTVTHTWPSTGTFMVNSPCSGGSYSGSQYSTPYPFPITGKLCSAGATQTTLVETGGALTCGAAVIEEGVAISWQQVWASRASSSIVYTDQGGQSYSFSDQKYGSTGPLLTTPNQGAAARFWVADSYGSGYSMAPTEYGYLYNPQPVVTTYPEPDPPTTIAILRDGEHLLGPGWAFRTVDGTPLLPNALVSAGGLALWSDTPTTATSNCSLPDEAINSDLKAWTGSS